MALSATRMKRAGQGFLKWELGSTGLRLPRPQGTWTREGKGPQDRQRVTVSLAGRVLTRLPTFGVVVETWGGVDGQRKLK